MKDRKFNHHPPSISSVAAAGVKGSAYVTGSGESHMETIPRDGPARGAVLKLKTIGEHLHMCGNARSVGRRDGKLWQRCAFPTNLWLTAVCCGGDGEVYVGGLHGHVYKGRGDLWKQICAGNLSARDGILLVAGHGGAAFHEDGQWKVIFHSHEMTTAARA